jgi:REP element-mobilizing transposase RayT
MMASTFTNLLYHIVYSTKFRQPLIIGTFGEELHKYIGGIIREHEGSQLEIGGISDHIHILAKFSPNIAVSEMLRLIKANSSKWANENHKDRGRFEWQTGYAAFSVSASRAPTVCKYIQNQEDHHRKRPFKVELIELLRKHHVEFDERYLFEEKYIV